MIRGGGLALLLGGIFQALGTVLHPNDTGATGYFFDPRWAPAHLALAVSYLLLVFGFTALYLVIAPKAEVLATFGFVVAEVGAVLLVGITLAEAFLLPVIASGRPPAPLAAWLDPTGPLSGAVVVSLVALVANNVGDYILGAAIWRAGRFPRPAVALLLLGTALTNGEFFGSLGFALYVLGGVTLGGGLAWLGFSVVSATMPDVQTQH